MNQMKINDQSRGTRQLLLPKGVNAKDLFETTPPGHDIHDFNCTHVCKTAVQLKITLPQSDLLIRRSVIQ